jgi:hypothetical protein
MMFSMRWAAAAVGLILACGCAKLPNGGGGTSSRRIHFVITLDGPVNPNFVYIVAIRDANDDTGGGGGPIPVIQQPWGNGFVAGKATHFVRYDGAQPSGGYLLNKFTDLDLLLTWIPIGVPFDFVTPNPGDNRLEFTITLSQLRPSDPNGITSLQVNILTMDVVPNDPHYNGPKYWDAFGDSTDFNSINDYLTINVQQDRVYRNSVIQNEPRGDVSDPSLDIVDWEIDITSP